MSTDNIGANYDYPEASYERRRMIGNVLGQSAATATAAALSENGGGQARDLIVDLLQGAMSRGRGELPRRRLGGFVKRAPSG